MFKNSRKGRKDAEFQCFGELRVAVLASSQWKRAATHRPENAEKQRSTCAKGLHINEKELAKHELIPEN